MPRKDKDQHPNKQKRQAEYIEESYEKKGVTEEKTEEIAQLKRDARKESTEFKAQLEEKDRQISHLEKEVNRLKAELKTKKGF